MEKRIEGLRARLNKILVRDLLSVQQASKDIGIHYTTFSEFLYGGRNIHLMTLGKIEQYLDRKEKECI